MSERLNWEFYVLNSPKDFKLSQNYLKNPPESFPVLLIIVFNDEFYDTRYVYGKELSKYVMELLE